MLKSIDIQKTRDNYIELFGEREGEIKFRLHCIKFYPDTSEGYGDVSSLVNILQSYSLVSLLSEVRTDEFLCNLEGKDKSKETDYLIETIVEAYRFLLNKKF